MRDEIRPLIFDPEQYPEDREAEGDCPVAPSPVEYADLLSSAIEVSKCAAHLADIVKSLMESREHTLPIFMEKFGKDSVIRQAREAHWLMEQLGEYLNGCDAITEEDAVWDATFEKARALFPLDNSQSQS